MMHDDSSSLNNSKGNVFSQAWKHFQQRYQKLLDDVTPYLIGRWISVAVLTCAFLARVFLLQGWYIVTYALGIYHLNLFIAFLSPKIDPAIIDYEDDGGPELPTSANEEFRPFIRRLPEFKFWYSVTKSTVIATICTFFDCFNIPVFWPILVMYFITLFCITMKRQIKHMVKYRYLPFTHGKPKYQGVDTGKHVRNLMYIRLQNECQKKGKEAIIKQIKKIDSSTSLAPIVNGQSSEETAVFEKT